jgi:hypothetical protein
MTYNIDLLGIINQMTETITSNSKSTVVATSSQEIKGNQPTDPLALLLSQQAINHALNLFDSTPDLIREIRTEGKRFPWT